MSFSDQQRICKDFSSWRAVVYNTIHIHVLDICNIKELLLEHCVTIFCNHGCVVTREEQQMWSKFYVIKYAQFATLSHEITRLQSCGLCCTTSVPSRSEKNSHLQMLYVNSYCENNCKIPFDPPHAKAMFSGRYIVSTSSWNFNELKPLTICTFHFVISLNCDMIGK